MTELLGQQVNKALTDSIKNDIATNPTLRVIDILEKYQLSYYEWRKLGITFRNKYHPSPTTLQAIEMLNAGMKNIAIAKELGISRQRITNIKRKYLGVLVGRREKI